MICVGCGPCSSRKGLADLPRIILVECFAAFAAFPNITRHQGLSEEGASCHKQDKKEFVHVWSLKKAFRLV